MSHVAVCTIVSKSYLAFARVLAHSLRRHHPELLVKGRSGVVPRR